MISIKDRLILFFRLPGAEDDKYVSVVGRDELASFQRNGHNGDEFGDEDIDFTPQNGYVEPEGMEYEEVGQGRKLKNPKKGKQQPALMGKIAAAGSAIKKARLPTPMELKEGYLNSAFHKSLHQPLIVKSKVEKEDVRVARQALTQEKSPTALGNINSVSDIPIPKVFASKPAEDGEERFPHCVIVVAGVVLCEGWWHIAEDVVGPWDGAEIQ